MFNFGGLEILVILVVALIVLGPDKLPRVMRSVGKTVGELRRASTEFQRTMNTELAVTETKKNEDIPISEKIEPPLAAPRTEGQNGEPDADDKAHAGPLPETPTPVSTTKQASRRTAPRIRASVPRKPRKLAGRLADKTDSGTDA